MCSKGSITIEQIADRLRTCVAVGSVHGAVALMREHGDRQGLLDELAPDKVELRWVFMGAPFNSLLHHDSCLRVFASSRCFELPRALEEELATEAE